MWLKPNRPEEAYPAGLSLRFYLNHITLITNRLLSQSSRDVLRCHLNGVAGWTLYLSL